MVAVGVVVEQFCPCLGNGNRADMDFQGNRICGCGDRIGPNAVPLTQFGCSAPPYLFVEHFYGYLLFGLAQGSEIGFFERVLR